MKSKPVIPAAQFVIPEVFTCLPAGRSGIQSAKLRTGFPTEALGNDITRLAFKIIPPLKTMIFFTDITLDKIATLTYTTAIKQQETLMTMTVSDSFAYANAQLANPAIMASMGGGNNPLGECLNELHTFVMEPASDVGDDPDYARADFNLPMAALNEKFAAARALNPTQDPFAQTAQIRVIADLGMPFDDAYQARLKEAVASMARRSLDPWLSNLARGISGGLSGIPVGRPRVEGIIEGLVHPGFSPQVLRALVDAGAIGHPTAVELGAALTFNLGRNSEALDVLADKVYQSSSLLYLFPPLALILGGNIMYADPRIIGMIAGALVTVTAVLAIIVEGREIYSSHQFNRSLGLPAFSTRAPVLELKAAQEKLLAGYEAALGRYPPFLDGQ